MAIVFIFIVNNAGAKFGRGGGGLVVGGWDKQSVLQAMRKREMAGLNSTYSCNLFISVATPSTCMFRP